jgi:hypothetical protein
MKMYIYYMVRQPYYLQAGTCVRQSGQQCSDDLECASSKFPGVADERRGGWAAGRKKGQWSGFVKKFPKTTMGERPQNEGKRTRLT